MAATHITKDTFDKEVLKNNKPTLVDFYADWCGPCKMVAPIIDELSEEMKDMSFVKLNVDESQEIAGQYSVFSIPTFIIFKNGQPVSQFVGAMGKEGFVDEIKKAQTA